MDISELTPEEDIALVGLLREIVQADGNYSDLEREHIHRIKDAIGDDRFGVAIAAAKEQVKTRSELKALAKTIQRQPARQLIYDLLYSVAASDGVHKTEEKPLEWLASWWYIDP